MRWLFNNLASHYVRAVGIGFQTALANCAAVVVSLRSVLALFIVGGSESAVREMTVSCKEPWLGLDTDILIFRYTV